MYEENKEVLDEAVFEDQVTWEEAEEYAGVDESGEDVENQPEEE